MRPPPPSGMSGNYPQRRTRPAASAVSAPSVLRHRTDPESQAKRISSVLAGAGAPPGDGGAGLVAVSQCRVCVPVAPVVPERSRLPAQGPGLPGRGARRCGAAGSRGPMAGGPEHREPPGQPHRAHRTAQRAPPPREREVLGLMAEGRTNTAIGGQLFLSERTVEGNVRRIFDKLGLADTPQDNRRVLAVLAFLRA